MKRRDFFTKLALTTAAVAVAPGVLSQEPGKALSPYRNVLNNPYYQWVRAKRSDVHVRDNNYWRCLEKATQPWDEAMEYSRKIIEASPKKYTKGKGGYISLCDPPLVRMYCPIQFREYDWVYQGAWIESYDPRIGINPKGIHWMNIEDLAFYSNLYDKKVFDPHYSNLLGVGLTPGLVDPLNPRGAYYQSPHLRWEGKNPAVLQTVYPVDSYEIHIMYQKIK